MAKSYLDEMNDEELARYRANVELIGKVATRAMGTPSGLDSITIVMDLMTCVTKQPLDFNKLLGFCEEDFWHDIYGINRNLNHSTLELENCFLPRCAKEQ